MVYECLGATKEVTGSGHLIDGKVLIDLGAHQGSQDDKRRNYDPFSFDPAEIEMAYLSHAHLDHSGLIPRLVKQGFRGNIYMTHATNRLTRLILLDQMKVLSKNGEPPLYSLHDLERAFSQFVSVPYDEPIEAGKYVAKLKNAWHILGSASLEISQAGQKYPTMFISGDLGHSTDNSSTLADIVVMESTYGNRNHPSEDPFDVFSDVIKQIEKQKGGTLLIPTFSVDRAQVILSILHYLELLGHFQKGTKVLLDSPMAKKATDIYATYLNHLSDFSERKNKSIFEFSSLINPANYKESIRLQKKEKPNIIMAGSGMLTGGLGRDHARRILPDEDSIILFTGFQGKGTLGRELIDGAEEVIIDDYTVPVKANIQMTESLSSHADQNSLTGWLNRLKVNNPRGITQVLVTHGEPESSQALLERIEQELGIGTIIPELNKEYAY